MCVFVCVCVCVCGKVFKWLNKTLFYKSNKIHFAKLNEKFITKTKATYYLLKMAQSAGASEYTHWISAEG